MKPAALHITARQAVDFTLARCGISQPFDEPLAAVRAMVAVQAQYAASIPFAVHARCPSASRAWTDRALTREKSLVKTWCLRGTLHTLATEDLALMVGSFGERYHLAVERVMLRMCDMDAVAWHRVEQDVLHALDGEPLDRTALHAAVPRLRDVPWSGWGEDVKGLAYQGDLLMVGSKGSRPVFARRDRWLPDLHFRPRTRIKSLEELLVRYLRTFSPATLSDFAHWTGLSAATVRDTATRAATLLIPVSVEGHASPLMVLAEDADVLQKSLPEVPPIALLPKFDAMLLAWKDPSRVLDGGDRGAVFRPAGQIEAVVLLQGHVAATWRVKQTPGRMHITIIPIRSVGIVPRRQVEAAFEGLGAWSGASSTTIAWQD
jgi:hypothetical protein